MPIPGTTDAHRFFLQGLLARRALPRDEAERLFANALAAASERLPAGDNPLDGFVSHLRQMVSPLQLDVKSGLFEGNGKPYIALVNLRKGDPVTEKFGGAFSPDEMKLFECVIASVLNADDGAGAISDNDAMLLNSNVPGMSQSTALGIVRKLTAAGWLYQPRRGMVSLGVRTLFEMGPELCRDDEERTCALCREMAITYGSCPNSACSFKFHPHCLTKIFRKRARHERRCTKCNTRWPNAPLLDELQSGRAAAQAAMNRTRGNDDDDDDDNDDDGSGDAAEEAKPRPKKKRVKGNR